MKSLHHFLVSLTFSAIAFVQGSPRIAVLCMLVGWLVDADHEIDHFIYTRRFVLNPLKLGEALSRQWHGTLYIPLHGWEFLYLILIASSVYNFSFLIALSYGCHLVMDILGNGIKIFEMSVFVRWSRGWKRQFDTDSWF